MTPLRWLTAARVREVRRLLEVSDLPVDEIARRSGLGSPANLRVHLARDAEHHPSRLPRRLPRPRVPRSHAILTPILTSRCLTSIR